MTRKKRGPYKNTYYRRKFGMSGSDLLKYLKFTNKQTLSDLNRHGMLLWYVKEYEARRAKK